MESTTIWFLIEALALAATRERKLLIVLLLIAEQEKIILRKPDDRVVLRRCLDELEFAGVVSRRLLKGGRVKYAIKPGQSIICDLAKQIVDNGGIGYKYALCVLVALMEGEPLNEEQIYGAIWKMDFDGEPSKQSMDDSMDLLRRAGIIATNVSALMIAEEWRKKLNADTAAA